MTIYISDLAISKVPAMTFDTFSVTLSYRATWSDRYAVHPCAINLYDTGRGVGAAGAFVPQASWWTPHPSVDDAVSVSVTHSDELRVMHDATTAVSSRPRRDVPETWTLTTAAQSSATEHDACLMWRLIGAVVTRRSPPKHTQTHSTQVRAPCIDTARVQSCPWPKQLFLQDAISLTANFNSDWDLSR